MVKKIILFLTIIMTISCHSIDDNRKKRCYHGIIIEIYRDLPNHAMWTFKVNAYDSIFEVSSDYHPYSWVYAEVGDSIIKESGHLYYMIKKQNGDSAIFCYI